MATLDRGDAVAPIHSSAAVSATDAVAELYRLHRAQMLRLAVFLIDDRAVAEELVQDAFAALYQRWDRIDAQGAALGYLRTTLVNAIRSAQRRQIMSRKYLRVPEPDAAPGADFALLLDEEHREVITALRRLPRRQREVLVLRYWASLSEADIAVTLGISRGTVKSTAARGLDALERQLRQPS